LIEFLVQSIYFIYAELVRLTCDNYAVYIVATTSQKTNRTTKINLWVKYLMGIIRELDKKSPMNCYPIYMIHIWSMLTINSFILKYTYCVKNERSGLNIFLFSLLIFISFLIYSPLFLSLELGLGLEWQDHTVTQQVTPDDMVTSHMTQWRK